VIGHLMFFFCSFLVCTVSSLFLLSFLHVANQKNKPCQTSRNHMRHAAARLWDRNYLWHVAVEPGLP